MPKFYNIDPKTCSKEELELAINNCKKKEDFYNNAQLSTKIAINSIYGVFGSSFYSLHSTDIAESITLQGQDLIKYSVRVVNEYFKNIWPTDIEAHTRVANYMKDRFSDFNITEFLQLSQQQIQFDTLQIYGDTDSAYITVQPYIDVCKIPLEQQITFALAINNCILSDYLSDAFDNYAKMYNCPENKEKFELEKIARAVIMLAKKKYIMDIGWAEPDVFHDPLHKLTLKGVEAIQGAVSEFCRNQMKDFIKFLLTEIDNGRIPQYDAIIRKLKDIKNKFALQSPNEISKSFKISDYEKYIINDKENIVQYTQVTKVNKAGDYVVTDITVPMHVKAAARYNNLLYNKAKRYKSKYNTIKRGDKIKFYYTADGDPFAFLPGLYPVEFAPKMDIDQQFEKMILDPLNRIIAAIGYNAVPVSLTYSASLW